MSVKNYPYGKWYDCGNEDMLDTWNCGDHNKDPRYVLDRQKERAAKKLHNSYPCTVRQATKEELERAFGL